MLLLAVARNIEPCIIFVLLAKLQVKEQAMARFIGSIVIAMFSLYGLAKFVSLHVVPSKGDSQHS